jgi:hypothetical protein
MAMAKVLLTVIGLLVLSIVGLGALVWNAGNQSIDPSTETGKNYAQTFKSTIRGNCNGFVGSQLGKLAHDSEVQDTVRDICECAADMTYNEFKNEPPLRLVSLATDPKARTKIGELMQECLDRADIPRPDEWNEADWADWAERTNSEDE